MIATLACLVAFGDTLSVGQRWDYQLTWHFVGQDIDTAEEESLVMEVTAVRPDSATVQVSQKLNATLIDGQRIPTDAKAVPFKIDWSFFPNRAVAFHPEGRYGLESRFFRVVKGIQPGLKGDAPRTNSWTLTFPDDGRGMPAASLAVTFLKETEGGADFQFKYLENRGTSATGHFVRNAKSLLPSLIEAKFTNTRMQGGTDPVDCEFRMKLIPKK